MPFQLTSTGLEIESIADINAAFEAAEYAGISPALNLQAPDPIAVMNGVIAERLNFVEELVGELYSGMIPDNATGDQLEGLSEITGSTRQPASATVVACSITVTAAFTAGAGTMLASVTGVPGVLYTNVSDFTAGGAGTTTGVEFECVDTGENAVSASTLTVISSPLANWSAITNPSAGITGQPIQSDASLRVARQAELAASGATNAAAIRADVLRLIQPGNSPLTIAGIAVGANYNPFTITVPTLACTVLWNDSDSTDANSLPPHSIEVIAYAPGATTSDDYALASLILVDKAAGVAATHGLAGKTVEDDQGTTEFIAYTRPASVPTGLITLTVKQKAGVVITVQQVQDAIATYASATTYALVPVPNAVANWTPGATAYASSIVGAVFEFVPGVANVTAVVITNANSGADLVPSSFRQIVTFGTITPTIT